MTNLMKNILFCILFPISTISWAEELNKSTDKAKDTWYALTIENDAITLGDHSDDGYTNGVAWSWGYDPKDSFAEIDMPNWIRTMSEWTYLNNSNNHGFSIHYAVVQGMFTPNDLEAEEVVEDDRPYAGTLTWATRIRSFDNHIANSLGLTLGVVGPASLAEQSQTGLHKLIGVTEPQGWDNQLENEPIFRIDAEHIRRLFDYNLLIRYSLIPIHIAERVLVTYLAT